MWETSGSQKNLECPVCLDNLLPPVFQCYNGHLLCKECCYKVEQSCPVCRETMPRRKKIRNLAIEEMIKLQIHPCRFRDRGCLVRVKYNLLQSHQFDCPFAVLQICSLLEMKKDCTRAVQIQDFPDHLMKDHDISIHFPSASLGESCVFEDKVPPLQADMAPRTRFVIICVPKTSSEIIFVLKVRHRYRRSSWTPYVVSSKEASKKFSCKISLMGSDEVSALSWSGRVLSLQSEAADETTSFDTAAGCLRSLCTITSEGLVYKGRICFNLK